MVNPSALAVLRLLALRRLLNRNIAWFRSSQDLVNYVGSTPKEIREACCVGNQPPASICTRDPWTVGSRAASAKLLI